MAMTSPSPTSPSKKASTATPPWEVLLLLSHHLDPKTLARASCVSKPWNTALSSDHLWKPICFSSYPSLSSLNPTISYRTLFSLLYTSSKRRRHRDPATPRISLHHLMFTIDVFCRDSPLLFLAKSGEELVEGPGGVFRFDVDVVGDNVLAVDSVEELRVSWTVVMKGWRGVFSTMDRVGRGRLVGGTEVWFSEELPTPGCCSASASSGLVAELGLGFSGGGVDGGLVRVSLGLMSIVCWRYVSVGDGLLYLQHFLLPSAGL